MNKYVLSLDLNDSKDVAERIEAGMLFQHLGPATENARSPKQVLDFRILRSPLASDRREGPDQDDDTPMQYALRYSGAIPWRDLYTSKASLYSMRYRTGSQCSTSRSSGVTWSYFLRLQTSRAAEFRTDCSLSSRCPGAPAKRLLQRST